MIRAALAALCIVLGLAGGAVADADGDAARAFDAALAAHDIAALERLGGSRPLTRWHDDAWSEAGYLALRASDFARARRDFEQVLAIGPELAAAGIAADEQLARRARLELGRLTGVAGDTGQWNAVAAEHERLLKVLAATGGDPQATLRALEALADQHAGYPRRASLMIAIARGWERDGDASRAVHWLERASDAARTGDDAQHARAELVRTLTRTGDLSRAEREIEAANLPRGLAAQLSRELAVARLRRALRWFSIGVLGLLGAIAIVALARSARSWRVALRRLARPPVEAIFLAPIAAVLVLVSLTGNPMVASAVRTILGVSLVASWLSGAILDVRTSPPGHRRLIAHALIGIVAVAAATYLAVDQGHLVDFVIETWRSGPQP